MNEFPSTSGATPLDLFQRNPVSSKSMTGPGRLSHVAGEFESILLSQWLQGAESSFGSVPGADDGQDAGDEQMKAFAVQALAKSFSDAGGIGIASMVSKALAEHANGASDVKQPEGTQR